MLARAVRLALLALPSIGCGLAGRAAPRATGTPALLGAPTCSTVAATADVAASGVRLVLRSLETRGSVWRRVAVAEDSAGHVRSVSVIAAAPATRTRPDSLVGEWVTVRLDRAGRVTGGFHTAFVVGTPPVGPEPPLQPEDSARTLQLAAAVRRACRR
ncbi:hypothetical protein J421_0933 [Gemmatirosa kalamazoonensis]|uniref:Uncharacterized protein n=1 Tax=Gemmatirosa kalamazoonensis TaxID=861299 RepID=W0RDR5_9BACT|nr:hypothetical protein [Gemmatirosa kalamazoonensis]AHG88470.1 hypothetical protein J421_0933 [Gemmatirosa kalamazoonensis]